MFPKKYKDQNGRNAKIYRFQYPGTDGTVTLYRALFQETSPGAEAGHSAVDYNSELGTPEPIYKMS